ncbi:MAG: ATP-binding cassette domain-containing protein, partial [Ferrovibrionaceae bacterium]
MPLACTQLTVAYGRRVALQDFGLALAPGEVRGLIGPNGSGKST